MIPYNISDLSITFFTKGRPWLVNRDNPHFDKIRSALLTPDPAPDPDQLVEWADVTLQLKNAGLVFENGVVLFNGTELHNVWVDKIIQFHTAGLPYDPIFNALKDLMTNPTPAAIERLPIFVERSGLGFLPDGRIAAYKGVRDSYFDVHTNTVEYAIGTTVAIDRELCDADPDRTCSSGLHLGALDYIQRLGYGWGRDRRLLLCAFWPRDVVAVPADYQGGKMRVCSLDVIEEVDRAFVDQHFSFNRLLVGAGTSDEDLIDVEEADQPLHMVAEVGDTIELAEGGSCPPGTYTVTSINDDPHTRCRVHVSGPSVSDFGVFNNLIMAVIKPEPWKHAKVGDRILLKTGAYHYVLDTDEVEVIATDESDPTSRLYVQDPFGHDSWVDNEEVLRVL